ncbi:unnamed protein product [Penicillium camemberti]|uniref:Str. FM013 n=1 Tax=Penicillium camemberti (strain FM 013) TaxID=1429867 RepID=A0A0G4NSW8_PENC3|nr:unnamed protein product [Penicillium camemberti]
MTFSSKRNAYRHAKEVHDGVKWPCSLAEEKRCTLEFCDQDYNEGVDGRRTANRSSSMQKRLSIPINSRPRSITVHQVSHYVL